MSHSTIDFHNMSIPDRLRLVEENWNSNAEDTETLPLTAEQRAELDRRCAEHEADPSTEVPWEDVRDELYGRDG